MMGSGLVHSPEYEAVSQILQKHGYSIEDADGISSAIGGFGPCYKDLYTLYVDVMPYGVAKARTGDPDQWIFDRICRLVEE